MLSYCNSTRCIFIVQVRDQNKEKKVRKLICYARGCFCFCVFKLHSLRLRERGLLCMTIKFNKVLVTDEACWQCAGPLPFSPRPKQPVWSNVNPFSSRARLHKHMGHLVFLQCIEILPVSSCLLTLNTFIMFKWKYLFPIYLKSKLPVRML